MSFNLKPLTKKWFEMTDLQKRRFANGTWIPVYGIKTISEEKRYPEAGFFKEILVIGAAVIFEEHREEAEEQGWSRYSHDNSSAFLHWTSGDYVKAEAFTGNSDNEIGFRLVLSQHTNPNQKPTVQLLQDFIYAYALIEEGDVWLKPMAGYEEVVRVKRDKKGVIIFAEIRIEYLRDYLAARNAALRLYYYRERDAVFANKPDFGFEELEARKSDDHDRFEIRSYDIDQTGDRPGSSWAIFTARRTDVDPDEDIPDFSESTDENTTSETHKGVRETSELRHRVESEMWRAEWIEPFSQSERLGSSEAEEDFLVATDAGEAKVNLESLNHETIGKYLWFDASLIPSLLAQRDGALVWYTKDTGGVSADSSSLVHFGVNQLGYINAYAYDIARLPTWERRIWAAKNIRPDGGVSAELLSAQQECRVAPTKAPEFLLGHSMDWLDSCCQEKYGRSILRGHVELDDVERRIHRFRALDENGLRGLTKDIVKFTIERLDKKALLKALDEKKSTSGTLKLLEQLLASVTADDFAKSRVAPLFGAYDLRLADAHLSSSDIASAYTRLGVNRDDIWLRQAETVLRNVADTIGVIGTQIKRHQGR